MGTYGNSLGGLTGMDIEEKIDYLGALRIGTMFGLSALHHYEDPRVANWLNSFDKIQSYLKGVSFGKYALPSIEKMIPDEKDRKRVVSSYEQLFEVARRVKAKEHINEEELEEVIKVGEQLLDRLELLKEKYKETEE